ncbi:hypothetical protein GE09DRAFT_1092435 [Coniochaeta sp. 2T2.1]|nr:hypothetical protein GE09DRAFT_1092435 [Coniochaeta sp. 2T2.1]
MSHSRSASSTRIRTTQIIPAFTMVSVTFSVGSPLTYRVRSLELPGNVHQIQADFQHGSHVFTSADFKLVTVHSLGGKPLIGRLSFRYTYGAASGIITVCGTDCPSADGMTLVTTPEGTNHVCLEHAAASAGFSADQASGPWNYRTQLMPGAAQVFKSIVRAANNALISALEASPNLTAVQIRKPLPELPTEHYLNLCVVYRAGRFLELFDHAKQYEPDDEVHSVESLFGGEVTFKKGENFANVIGSTGDKEIGGLSWIRLWAGEFGFYPTTCESFVQVRDESGRRPRRPRQDGEAHGQGVELGVYRAHLLWAQQ